MNITSEQEDLLKCYLLGIITPEEDEQFELRKRNGEITEELLLVEEQLIDDYALGKLAPFECELFERYFLSTEDQLTKLLIAEAAVRYAANQSKIARKETEGGLAVFTYIGNRWQFAACAVLVFVIAFGYYFWTRGRPELANGLYALNNAFREQRPTQTRITGFAYAVANLTRGGKVASQTPAADFREMDEAEVLLRRAARENENADTLHALGKLYLARREFDKAIENFEKALAYNANDARTHSDLGAALVEKLKNSGEQNKDVPETVDKAFSHINKALELDGNLLEALFNRALLYQLQNLKVPAQEAWKKYLEKDSSSKWADEANSYLKELQLKSSNSGDERYEGLYRNFLQASKSGDGDKAWQLYNDSYNHHGNFITDKLIDEFLVLTLANKEQEAEDRMRTVEYLARLSQLKSEDLFLSDLALAYRQANKDQRLVLARGRRLRQSAFDLSFNQALYQEAIVAYLKAKTLFLQAHAPPEAATVDYWIAEAYLRQSNHKKSLQTLLSVSARCERQRYRWLRALTFNRLAAVLGDRFLYSEAIQYSLDAANEFSRIGDKSGQLRVLINQASLYLYVGKYRDVLNLCQICLVLAKEVAAADDNWIHILHAIAGWSYCKLGFYSAALEFQNESVRMVEKLKLTHAISRYNVFVGVIQSRLKDYDKAISSIERGLDLGLQQENSAAGQDMINYARLYLGQVYREAGKPAESMKVLEQATEFYKKSGWEAQSYLIAKEILLDQIAIGDISSATRQLELILGFLEEHRKKILQQSNRNSFFDMEQPVYDIAISFAYETLNQPERAFAYSELSRARSLLDSATATRQIVKDFAIPEEVLSGSTRPMTLVEIQARTPAETQILQYAVLKDRIIAWVVSREGVESRTIQLDADQLSNLVKAYLNLVAKPSAEDDPNLGKISSELYENLISPVADFLDKKRKLCIVPDKILNFLPYGSLLSKLTGKYLIEDYSLLFAPSSTLFIRSTENAGRKARTKEEKLLSVGNPLFDRSLFKLPDLPSASVEAEEITNTYGRGISLIGKDATKQSLLREIENADVVHLATHYVPDERSPMLSKLILARRPNSKDESDCTLALYEVYRLKLSRARLVVLSACQTNAEQYYAGEGPIGLSHAFASIGVPLVISSLWQTNSDTTEKLMVRFHSLRNKSGDSTVDALREAQIEMLKSPDKRLHHPYHWAAFIVGGGYSRF